MNHVAPRVSRAEAEQILLAPFWERWPRWRRTDRATTLDSMGRGACVREWELVGLPYYLLSDAADKLSAALAERGLWIDGHEGGCAALARGVRLEWADGEPEILCLPPSLTPDEAHRVAAEHRARTALFLRRAPRETASRPVPACWLVHYPFWVRYVRLRGGRLDVRLADAVSGRRAGAREKRAFLAGLALSAGSSCSTPPLVESEVPA